MVSRSPGLCARNLPAWSVKFLFTLVTCIYDTAVIILVTVVTDSAKTMYREA